MGVIHVHSAYSDGRLPVEAIARIADGQGLDFLILTDHNTLRGKSEGKEGLYGKTLVLIGEEISTQGHYLALRVEKEVPARKDPQWTVDQVAEQGGLGFIAHPFWKRAAWKNPEARGFAGLEIYNAADDATDENPAALVFWTLAAGSDFTISRWLDRPAKALDFWDRCLAERGRTVGIGGADAHGLVWFGLRLAPYDTVFKLVRNHLLVRGEVSPDSVYDALEKGRLFVAHDILADARGFSFVAVKGDSVRGTMGEEVRREPGLHLHAHLPSPGEMTLFFNSRPVGTRQGREARFDVREKGIYRLEVARKGRPWIYTNPVYVIE